MADEAKSMKSVKTTKSKRNSKAPGEEEETAAAPQQQEEDGGWKKFIWNDETREFLGRTGKSWFLIFVFYVIFFISLFAFFMLNWYLILLMSVTQDHPSKYGDTTGSMLYQDGPGLTIRPLPDQVNNPQSSLIWFSVGVYENYRWWKNQLSGWFSNIPVAGNPETKVCTLTFIDEADTDSCLVPTNIYGPCSPQNPATPNLITDFGYSRGEPCILVKINRIYNWKPAGDCTGACNDNMPPELNRFRTNQPGPSRVLVWCQGQFEHDKENLGAIEYFPGPYIETKYFPFKVQKNYQSPFFMMQLKRPLAGALISIECQVYDNNIKRDDDKKAMSIGYSKFQIIID